MHKYCTLEPPITSIKTSIGSKIRMHWLQEGLDDLPRRAYGSSMPQQSAGVLNPVCSNKCSSTVAIERGKAQLCIMPLKYQMNGNPASEKELWATSNIIWLNHITLPSSRTERFVGWSLCKVAFTLPRQGQSGFERISEIIFHWVNITWQVSCEGSMRQLAPHYMSCRLTRYHGKTRFCFLTRRHL